MHPENNWAALFAFLSLVVSVIIGPVVQAWLARKNMKWQEETHSKLREIDHGVRNASETATLAYEAANHVNEWRNEMTHAMRDGQQETHRVIEETRDIATDTNRKVTAAAKRPAVMPLVILPPPPEQRLGPGREEDMGE